MNQSSLEKARNELSAQRIALRGTSETLVGLHARTNARVDELDEHTRRLADCIRHAKRLGEENSQADDALNQCRNDIKAALGPSFARDLWRELVDALDVIDSEVSFNEMDAYLAIASWLHERPQLDAFLPLKADNVVFGLKCTLTLFEIWPELKVALKIVEPTPPTELSSEEDHRVSLASEILANPPTTFNPSSLEIRAEDVGEVGSLIEESPAP